MAYAKRSTTLGVLRLQDVFDACKKRVVDTDEKLTLGPSRSLQPSQFRVQEQPRQRSSECGQGYGSSVGAK